MKLSWCGHSSFKLTLNSEVLFIDPVRSNKLLNTYLDQTEKADVVLVTHNHWDHCDADAIAQLSKETTRFLVPEETMDVLVNGFTFYVHSMADLKKLLQQVEIVEPGIQKKLKNNTITVFSASEGVSFLITGEVKILFMGDSTVTEAMLETRAHYVVCPYWALKEKKEQAKIATFPDTTKIIVCHHHTINYGLPHFYLDEKSFEILFKKGLNIIRLDEQKEITLH
ncbi:MBL fold metallo-hydrolase [candidate division CSSED10-310 bacterium]|uniref:MBL fold metallo-hydrolase n=1 Tax=candidate division CSSED10-310 bacterium TaxID=2855610 RepID=A0ABV6YZB3_UNCC1